MHNSPYSRVARQLGAAKPRPPRHSPIAASSQPRSSPSPLRPRHYGLPPVQARCQPSEVQGRCCLHQSVFRQK
eukprot:2948076-Pleurochrysis_carterae.AAC.2